MKKVLSVCFALALVFGLGCATAFAEGGTIADGTYAADAVFTDVDEQNVISPLFAETAYVTVSGETAVLAVYIADPVPAGGGACSEAISVSSPAVNAGGTDYTGTVGMQDATGTFRASDGPYAIAEGAVLTCDTLTFTLPTSAFTADGTSSFVVTLYVEPLIGAYVSVRVDITGIPAAAEEPAAEPAEEAAAETPVSEDAPALSPDGAAEETPEETDEGTDGEEQPAEPSYTVTVPASAAMGSLSADKDTTEMYTVAVEASDLGDGYIDITAPALGTLSGEGGSIVFSNRLAGNTGISENASVTGTLTVSAANAAAAAPGSYTGTLNFTVSYYAG